MKVTPSIVRQEFIGLNVKVVDCKNAYCKGLSGRIIDETKKTFTILHEGKKKMVIKEISVFHFTFPDGAVVEIDGKVLVGRPEERLKKQIRRLW
ncbi:ribonuclease P protein subunit [Candidatus Bathyarchaeota archaeon]|nr:MAG: ribonuclease P protein subunit [Candidatus Bathyarchaeota archaeon]